MTTKLGVPSAAAGERGAMLIHVAISMLALCAFAVFAVDWGVFLVSRRQAQNSADASALAGAIALAYDDPDDHTDTGPAKRSAFTAAQQNVVWGQAPNVDIATDITFPTCPDGSGDCLRVDIHRSQARGNPLPVFFGSLIGITEQGVRATATAQVAVANATNCLKPWMIPDKWQEHYPVNPGVYDPEKSEFNTQTSGKNPVPLANPDQYRPPTSADMTGYRATGTPNDIGMLVTLKGEDQNVGLTTPGWLYAVRLNPGDSGADDYKDHIERCSGDTVRIGDRLQIEQGVKNGPTKAGVDTLIEADKNAEWYDPDGPGGTPGKVVNSCMDTASCPAPWSPSPIRSPRVVAVALFNPAEAGNKSPTDLQVVNILGFFLLNMKGKDVQGYFTQYPGLVVSGGTDIIDDAAFSRTVTLVR
jgi:hypothetical protein